VQVTDIITSHVELVFSVSWWNEPALPVLTDSISEPLKLLELKLEILGECPVIILLVEICEPWNMSSVESGVDDGSSDSMLAHIVQAQIRNRWGATDRAGEEFFIFVCDLAWNIANFGSDVTRVKSVTFNSQVNASSHVSSIGGKRVDNWDSLGDVASGIVI